MDRIFQLNPFVSFREKGGVCVFYIDFAYIFFKDKSARLLRNMMGKLERKEKIGKDIPDSFIEYLIDKKIIVEIRDE